MKNSNKKIINLFLIALITFSAFLGFGNRVVYLVSGITLMFISALATIKNKMFIDKKNNPIHKAIVLWSIYNILLAIPAITTKTFYISLIHVGIVIYFYYINKRTQDESTRTTFEKFLKALHYSLLLFILLLFITNNQNLSEYETLIYLGLGTIPFTLSHDQDKKSCIRKVALLSLLWAIVALVMGARAQVLSFTIAPIGFIWLTSRKVTTKMKNITFIIVFIFANIFPIIYANTSTSELGQKLTNASLSYTSSRFFSGRDKLWSTAYSKLDNPQKIIFGIGINETSKITQEYGMSLHNLYVTCLLEGGVILVLLLGLLLYAIWNRLGQNETLMAKITMAIMLSVLFKQSFDVSLIENNVCYAIILWTTFAIGLRNAQTDKEKKASL